jgi:hypothetical protein
VNWLCTISALISTLYQPHSPHFTCTLARYSFVLALAWWFRGKSRGDIDAFPGFGPDIGGCHYVSYLICICQHLSVNLGMPSLLKFTARVLRPSSHLVQHSRASCFAVLAFPLEHASQTQILTLSLHHPTSASLLPTALLVQAPAAVKTTLSTVSL